MFAKLEVLQKKCIDSTLFCVLQETNKETFQVVAMRAYNVMISCTGYHYDRLIDDSSVLKRDGYVIAFDLNDSIGNFTAVLGERCFMDSQKAFEKAEKLNREKI